MTPIEELLVLSGLMVVVSVLVGMLVGWIYENW